MATRSIKASQWLESKELSPSWQTSYIARRSTQSWWSCLPFSVLSSSLKHVLQEKVWIKDLQIDGHKRAWQPAKRTGHSMQIEIVNRVLICGQSNLFDPPICRALLYAHYSWCTGVLMNTHDVKMAQDNWFRGYLSERRWLVTGWFWQSASLELAPKKTLIPFGRLLYTTWLNSFLIICCNVYSINQYNISIHTGYTFYIICYTLWLFNIAMENGP